MPSDIPNAVLVRLLNSKAASLETIGSIIKPGGTAHADEATHWDALRSPFMTKRFNHEWAYSDGEA